MAEPCPVKAPDVLCRLMRAADPATVAPGPVSAPVVACVTGPPPPLATSSASHVTLPLTGPGLVRASSRLTYDVARVTLMGPATIDAISGAVSVWLYSVFVAVSAWVRDIMVVVPCFSVMVIMLPFVLDA